MAPHSRAHEHPRSSGRGQLDDDDDDNSVSPLASAAGTISRAAIPTSQPRAIPSSSSTRQSAEVALSVSPMSSPVSKVRRSISFHSSTPTKGSRPAEIVAAAAATPRRGGAAADASNNTTSTESEDADERTSILARPRDGLRRRDSTEGSIYGSFPGGVSRRKSSKASSKSRRASGRSNGRSDGAADTEPRGAQGGDAAGGGGAGDEGSDTGSETEADPKERWWKRVMDKYGSVKLENRGSVARDHLALERTFLAWLRTSLSFASIGIAVTQLFRLNTSLSGDEGSVPSEAQLRLRHVGKPLGATFLAIGIVTLLIGFHRYFESQHYVIRGKFPASRGSIIGVALMTAALIIASFVVILSIAPASLIRTFSFA